MLCLAVYTLISSGVDYAPPACGVVDSLRHSNAVADWPTGQSLFLISHPDLKLVNILLSTTRVSLVQNKFVFCQFRVHYIGDPDVNVHSPGSVRGNVRSVGSNKRARTRAAVGCSGRFPATWSGHRRRCAVPTSTSRDSSQVGTSSSRSTWHETVICADCARRQPFRVRQARQSPPAAHAALRGPLQGGGARR